MGVRGNLGYTMGPCKRRRKKRMKRRGREEERRKRIKWEEETRGRERSREGRELVPRRKCDVLNL